MGNNTHFSAAVLQQNIDVLFVLKMVIKVHNVLVMKGSMQLDFSVNLTGEKRYNVSEWHVEIFGVQMCQMLAGCALLTFSRW